MTITPQDIISQRQHTEIATGPVAAIGNGFAAVKIRQDLTVTALVGIGSYVEGQVVSVAIPAGNLSAAQVIGPAGGATARVRQICVKIGE